VAHEAVFVYCDWATKNSPTHPTQQTWLAQRVKSAIEIYEMACFGFEIKKFMHWQFL
jgi:hypothetical protein